jgi:signal transduction histidine kinase
VTPRRWTPSLRLRVVLITVAAVMGVVGVGDFLIIRDVRSDFIEAADWLAGARANEVAKQLADNGELPRRLPEQDEGETIVWVVRDQNLVSASTRLPADRLPVDLPGQPVGARTTFESVRLPTVEGERFRVIAHGADSVGGPTTVYVGVRVDEIEEFVRSAVSTGAMGLLLLVLPLGLVLWLAVGRTLAPVEAIRERAATISARRLSDRVPVPAREDEIGRLARTLNEMLSRLDVAARDQRRFLADAAHELRSPIASLRTQLETGSTTDGQVLSRDDLLAETLRMQTLVDQFLVLARSESGAPAITPVPVDLDDTVEAVVAARRAERACADVTIDIDDVHPVRVQGEPGLLEQMVRNLLENAERYARSTVRIGLTHDEQHNAVLTVDDDGPGIPAAHREDVFRRFMRIDPARDRAQGGAGLGLAIVHDVASAHRGEVVVLDSPSGGARLRVTLPAEAPVRLDA